MPIQVLPPAVAAKIAAGEVIERPASVVKELVENALDAGATSIAVEVLGGGLRLIRVRDNGCGLDSGEALLAFQRHATSKIARAEDLLSITTLGFRGEALPSIAAVAEVTLLTRPLMALGGSFVHFRGGRLVATSTRGAPAGTTVTVRDLFSEYPARRKFLRSPATEAGHCTTVVSHCALARPDVKFNLELDGKRVLQTSGSGSVRDPAATVLGTSMAKVLLEIAPPEETLQHSGGDQSVRVTGLVSPPGITRSTRGSISTFVNGRWVQNRALSFAVEEAYHGWLMTGRHPIAIVYLLLPPQELDVNVHPRKLEVRFRQESEGFAAVQRAIRRTLMATAPLELSSRFVTPPISREETAQLLAFQQALLSRPAAPAEEGAQPFHEVLPQRPSMPLLRVLGQLSNTYIITEGPDGMYLVDQHAAHERVMFERVTQRLEKAGLEQQGLLESQVVELAADELPLLLEEQGMLERYGFILEPFGERQAVVRAIPAGLREKDLRQVVREVLTGIRARDKLQEYLATSIACHSAVRAGDTLTLEEMRRLLHELETCSAPHTCPHGRPTMMHLSASQLEREFGRRG